MKVVVFIQQIVNPQAKLEGLDYFDSSKATEDDLIINPTDKNALEGALKLKDNEGAEVTVVCASGITREKAVREAIAMGCDNGIVIEGDIYDYDPYVLAKVYAKVLEKISDYDLVLLGAEEQAKSTYATAAMLGVMINKPTVIYAEEINSKDNNTFEVSHILEGGRKIVEMPKTGVISCSDSPYFSPRYTSMRGILKAKRAVIPKWNLDELGLSKDEVSKESAKLQVVSLEKIVIEKESYILKDEEPEAMVDKLLAKLKEDGIKLKGV